MSLTVILYWSLLGKGLYVTDPSPSPNFLLWCRAVEFFWKIQFGLCSQNISSFLHSDGPLQCNLSFCDLTFKYFVIFQHIYTYHKNHKYHKSLLISVHEQTFSPTRGWVGGGLIYVALLQTYTVSICPSTFRRCKRSDITTTHSLISSSTNNTAMWNDTSVVSIVFMYFSSHVITPLVNSSMYSYVTQRQV